MLFAQNLVIVLTAADIERAHSNNESALFLLRVKVPTLLKTNWFAWQRHMPLARDPSPSCITGKTDLVICKPKLHSMAGFLTLATN